MEESFFLAVFLKILFLVTTPITFLVGIFLLYDIDTYLRLEKFLAKSYFLSRKTFLKQLEKNRESLQLFLLKKRRVVGVICLLNSVMAVYMISFWLKVH